MSEERAVLLGDMQYPGAWWSLYFTAAGDEINICHTHGPNVRTRNSKAKDRSGELVIVKPCPQHNAINDVWEVVEDE